MRILIINRSVGEFANYGDVIDHDAHAVAYVTIAAHVPQIPAKAARFECVDRLASAGDIVSAGMRSAAALGGVDCVITTTEVDQLTAALLRRSFGCSGATFELIERFRDKVLMKTVLAKSGIRVPRFTIVENLADVRNFMRETSGDVIVKPRSGVASGGCRIIKFSDLPDGKLADVPMNGFEVEEFVDGRIWHVDGMVVGGDVSCSFAWQYVGTCYGFANGEPLGSVMRCDAEALAAEAFAAEAVRSLGLRTGVFHLEAILTRAGFVFLEVAARVGGSYIPYLLRDVVGIDFVRQSILMQMGEPPEFYRNDRSIGGVGGLVFPEAVGKRVSSIASMRNDCELVFREMLPSVGHIFIGNGEYEDVMGTFLLAGDDAMQIEAAIGKLILAFAATIELTDADERLVSLRA